MESCMKHYVCYAVHSIQAGGLNGVSGARLASGFDTGVEALVYVYVFAF